MGLILMDQNRDNPKWMKKRDDPYPASIKAHKMASLDDNATAFQVLTRGVERSESSTR